MTLYKAIIYGIIQGLTEFLPVSSSGHLALAQDLLSYEGADVTFNVFLHLGTLAAVIAVFGKDVLMLVKGALSLASRPFRRDLSPELDNGEKTFLYICIATIPLFPAALFADKIEWISGSATAVGIFLIINGLMLGVSDKLSSGRMSVETAGAKKALFIGMFQLLGVLPGISRSGSTVTGGLFNGFDRQNAVRFSFLMSLPAICGAFALEFKDVGLSSVPVVYIVGALTAAAVGVFSIKLLQYLARSASFAPFTAYCIAVGAAAIIADVII